MTEDEDDLWFLPGPMDDDVPPGAPPLPRADRRALIDPATWRAAQGAQSDGLARLALTFGEMDARLRAGSVGLRQRLALAEAADMAWWAGERFPAERLGLWVGLRVGSTEDSEGALARAGWAARRLMQGNAPVMGMGDFLNRPSEAVYDLAALLPEIEDLHPVTQSAILFHAWQLTGPDRGRDLEAAVLAARHAAGMSRLPGQGALFVPLAMNGPDSLRARGTPAQRLAQWIAGAERATLAALLMLDRLGDWRTRADGAIADLSGRVPGLLLEVLQNWPLVPAPLAEAQTGASRAAVQRNLDRLSERGLIREVTGQGRFRVWVARI
ncbi:hypothetical protein [Pararhodobacter zhoushanensis]|uniref:HTH DNA binding domain-containing protein n=1 Tax=Pararhodobacter zhoushanensis TaxID=2479545 RepID=A0ABT3H560_9RHOB|nr:hypothetical protein [Pararhodobacter zhoushanensis]MCW1934893.1 hypothetical protein [Pararhodobacter zhoushanensis]